MEIIVTLICISPMTSEVASFHVLVVYLYVFGEVFFQIFSPFLGWIIFLLLNYVCLFLGGKNPMYSGYCPLPDTWFLNIFSHSVSCLFTFLILPLNLKSLVGPSFYIYLFFLLLLVYLVSCLRDHCVILSYEDLLLFSSFLLRVLYFKLLHLGLWSILRFEGIIYFWLCWVFVAMCGLSLVLMSAGSSVLLVHSFSLQWLLFLQRA